MNRSRTVIDVDRKMIDRMNIIWSLKYRADEAHLIDFARDLGVTEKIAKWLLGRGLEFLHFTVSIRSDFCGFIGITEWWLQYGDLSNYKEKGDIPVAYLAQPEDNGLVQIFLTNRTPRRIVCVSESFYNEQEAAGTFGEQLEHFHILQGNRQ